MTSSGPVASFMNLRRIAFVGLSRDPRDFSRSLFRDWAARGYDLVPVHPSLAEAEGRPCYRRVQEIPGGVEGVFVMTGPAAAEQVLRDAADAGVRRVWLHRGAGQGAVSEGALAVGRERGLEVVPGACPYMFLSGAGVVHRFHGFVLKLLGRKPD